MNIKAREKLIVALDVETGRILWQAEAPAARLHLPHPAGAFFPGYLASAAGVLLQTTSGRQLALDPWTGQCIRESGNDHEPWPGVASRSEVRRVSQRNTRFDDVQDRHESHVRRQRLSSSKRRSPLYRTRSDTGHSSPTRADCRCVAGTTKICTETLQMQPASLAQFGTCSLVMAA